MPVAQEETLGAVAPEERASRRRKSAAGFAAAASAVMHMKRVSKDVKSASAGFAEAGRKRRHRTDAELGGRIDTVKASVWMLFENPKSSWQAMVISKFVLACIVASAVCIHLETLPALEGHSHFWGAMEFLFVVVFSIEYGIRAWATPQPFRQFFFDTYNMIDFVAIVPFYLVIVAEAVGAVMGMEIDLNLNALRILRLFRIFKIAKYSHATQLLLRSLSRAASELLFLVGFMFCALVFFGTLMYAVEQGTYNEEMGCYVRDGDSACSPFESIPGTFYWGVTTMTTVGYGDVLPTTRAGTVVACMTMFMGILVIALPVTMISNAFMDAHDEVSMEVKREHIEDRAQAGLLNEAEKDLVESSGELHVLLGRVNASLGSIHVCGAELLMAQNKYDHPEEALRHWDHRVALAADVTKRGLANLKSFSAALRPNHVC